MTSSLLRSLAAGAHANTAEGRPSPLIRHDLSGTAVLRLSRTRVFSLRIVHRSGPNRMAPTCRCGAEVLSPERRAGLRHAGRRSGRLPYAPEV